MTERDWVAEARERAENYAEDDLCRALDVIEAADQMVRQGDIGEVCRWAFEPLQARETYDGNAARCCDFCRAVAAYRKARR